MTKIDPSLLSKVPLSYFLGTLGMPGERGRQAAPASANPFQRKLFVAEPQSVDTVCQSVQRTGSRATHM